ncbi:MAG TPA: 2-succinyl-5-enolpyruvyl-6-hydroxy-3-cyclohexene-1-carboxylic-acid synthase [Thermoleophilaceae bacterium]|nr:2-succinyl-5-enolpyruvyl-6-hydroxy-3-cyclohexene-1-carboxylic-acid synthase [Thermoleophilaceae bacterium]
MNRTFAPLEALVDELARCGMRHAVASPGSRNAPLLLTLAAERRIETHSVLDERSAGYVALGLARATGRPVAVTCTSGTAAANLMPAVVEASEGRVPLVVLTADRPPELRDVGAGQSIDQVKLYGSAVKWFVEVGSHEPTRGTAIHHRALACRAFHTAGGGRPGPVHLNFPLREPLSPEPDEHGRHHELWAGRADGRPWVDRREPPLDPDPADLQKLAERIANVPRGAIIAGATGEHDIAEPAARLAAATGWPLLAEPTSGLRCGPHDRSHVVAHYDVLLRSETFAERHRPELVLRLGDTPTSKPLREWLASARQVVIDPHAAWHEPTRAAETIVGASPSRTCAGLADALRPGAPHRDADWTTAWRRADALVPEALAEAPDPFEPKAYAALPDSLPNGATVFVSSSMPIRYAETFFPQVSTRLHFLANRGANGIDGVVSTAAGAALAGGGQPCVLLIGELALLHDLSGLVAARHLGAPLTVVCANNGGGGIFDFLPVAKTADPAAYERLIATPREVDLAQVSALGGLRHLTARTPDEVRTAVGQPALVELPLDRTTAVERHRAVLARVEAGLS